MGFAGMQVHRHNSPEAAVRQVGRAAFGIDTDIVHVASGLGDVGAKRNYASHTISFQLNLDQFRAAGDDCGEHGRCGVDDPQRIAVVHDHALDAHKVSCRRFRFAVPTVPFFIWIWLHFAVGGHFRDGVQIAVGPSRKINK